MPPRSLTSRFRVAQLDERARSMRKGPTSSEARLFEALRGAALGVSFRWQVPLLGRFIADMLAPEVRLLVEVDGLHHTRRQQPTRRDRPLTAAGYTVLQLDAQLAMHDLDAALARIVAAVERLQAPR